MPLSVRYITLYTKMLGKCINDSDHEHEAPAGVVPQGCHIWSEYLAGRSHSERAVIQVPGAARNVNRVAPSATLMTKH